MSKITPVCVDLADRQALQGLLRKFIAREPTIQVFPDELVDEKERQFPGRLLTSTWEYRPLKETSLSTQAAPYTTAHPPARAAQVTQPDRKKIYKSLRKNLTQFWLLWVFIEGDLDEGRMESVLPSTMRQTGKLEKPFDFKGMRPSLRDKWHVRIMTTLFPVCSWMIASPNFVSTSNEQPDGPPISTYNERKVYFEYFLSGSNEWVLIWILSRLIGQVVCLSYYFQLSSAGQPDALRGKELLRAFIILWLEQVYLLLIDHKLEITRLDDKVFGGVSMKHFNSIKAIKSVKCQMLLQEALMFQNHQDIVGIAGTTLQEMLSNFAGTNPYVLRRGGPSSWKKLFIRERRDMEEEDVEGTDLIDAVILGLGFN